MYYDKIETELRNFEKINYTSSSIATYDRFPYDNRYTYMYTDHVIGAHRQLNPLKMGDWGTNAIIHCYKHYLSKYAPDNARILDFGTGVGWPAYWIEGKNYSIVGVDASSKMISLAREAKHKFHDSKIEFICADGENLPFADNEFDAITMDRVLEFTQYPNKIMNELSRVLKPNGVLIAGITNWQNAFGRTWGGFVDGKRILYPKREAKKILMPDGSTILKYRCCSIDPPEERSYYITFNNNDYLDKLVDVINNDYVDAAIIAIKKFGIKEIDAAICTQYTPDTHKSFFNSTNFEVINVHGVRNAINSSATYFIKQFVTKHNLSYETFEMLIKGLIKILQYSDPRKDLDMFTVAYNRKDAII